MPSESLWAQAFEAALLINRAARSGTHCFDGAPGVNVAPRFVRRASPIHLPDSEKDSIPHDGVTHPLVTVPPEHFWPCARSTLILAPGHFAVNPSHASRPNCRTNRSRTRNAARFSALRAFVAVIFLPFKERHGQIAGALSTQCRLPMSTPAFTRAGENSVRSEGVQP